MLQKNVNRRPSVESKRSASSEESNMQVCPFILTRRWAGYMRPNCFPCCTQIFKDPDGMPLGGSSLKNAVIKSQASFPSNPSGIPTTWRFCHCERETRSSTASCSFSLMVYSNLDLSMATSCSKVVMLSVWAVRAFIHSGDGGGVLRFHCNTWWA